MTVENISRSISTEECCWIPQPPDHQLDMHLTEARGQHTVYFLRHYGA